MDAVSSVIITKALDGLAMRAAATAQNIAGASGRAYQPLRVRFEDALRTAAAEGNDAVRAVTPALERMPAGLLAGRVGDEPRLDLELATASDTALRYGALVDLLGREMRIARAALGTGQ